MTEQFQRYNEPYILNAAYDALIKKGVDKTKYFMKALRNLAQRAPVGISAEEKIELLDSKYAQAISIITDQKKEIETLKIHIKELELIIKLKSIKGVVG